jgi:hypothetical protein
MRRSVAAILSRVVLSAIGFSIFFEHEIEQNLRRFHMAGVSTARDPSACRRRLGRNTTPHDGQVFWTDSEVSHFHIPRSLPGPVAGEDWMVFGTFKDSAI